MSDSDDPHQFAEPHPVIAWRRRWRPELEDLPFAPTIRGPMRWWEKALLLPVLLVAVGCCGIAFWAVVFTESSLDPRDTDVVYWNDTEATVIVWECGRDCSDLGKHYTLKPDGMKFYSVSRHPRPAAIFVKDLDGSVLGCTGVDRDYVRVSLYYRVSMIDDCTLITPAPTK